MLCNLFRKNPLKLCSGKCCDISGLVYIRLKPLLISYSLHSEAYYAYLISFWPWHPLSEEKTDVKKQIKVSYHNRIQQEIVKCPLLFFKPCNGIFSEMRVYVYSVGQAYVKRVLSFVCYTHSSLQYVWGTVFA